MRPVDALSAGSDAGALQVDPPGAAAAALGALWHAAGLPQEALPFAWLTGAEPVLPSSFAVGTAAQSSLAAAALAAAELRHQRGRSRQQVAVGVADAALECCGHFTLDGRTLDAWDKLSGLYACGDGGWVRIHANFAHHRDGALKLLGLPPGAGTPRAAVEQALLTWRAGDFEAAAADAGLVVAAARSFDEWDAHPQGRAVTAQPLLRIEPIDGVGWAPPRRWPDLAADAAPLHGLRVLDLTRILAGPVAGRTLAAYGADVLLVNSPRLPNIGAIADTSRGKLSAHVDLLHADGPATLRGLLADAHVMLQSYRPGALQAFGFCAQDAARCCPGIVHVSLSAYGPGGPWSARRGFDSLVQTATGFNVAEAQAAGSVQPKALPLQMLDYAAGYLMAFGAQAALWRQAREGGSWWVEVSLAGVGHWLRSLGRVANGFAAPAPAFEPLMESADSGFGRLQTVRHAARFADTPPRWRRPSMPPGSHPPCWPQIQ